MTKGMKSKIIKPKAKPGDKRLGNKFWQLRSKHGRNKLFKRPKLLWEAACEYFEWCDNNPFMEVEQKRGSISVKITSDISPKKLDLSPTVKLPRLRAYTIQGLCLYLCCNVKYFNEFDKNLIGKDDKLSKDFSDIVTRIRETIYTQKFTGAAAGFFNANIIARDLGLIEKSESKHDLSDDMKAFLKPFKSKKAE